ncbi:hypothetical protein HD806DRAFT_499638 [Xylariaceae sp. AK1471]|nr:hypothetical protein HD806DRAFT_499638 [Xylariaceae sp. AK1471]
MEHLPKIGACSSLLSLPPEIRIMIYQSLVQNEQEYIKLKWISTRVRSRIRYYKGIFGLLLTSRMIYKEVEPIVQAYINRSAHQISFRQLDRYLKSELPAQHSVRQLRITVDSNCRGRSVDLLPLICLQRQHLRYDIGFDIKTDRYQRGGVVENLIALIETLGEPSSLINRICSTVQISWRDSPVPFIVFTPVWCDLQDNRGLHEYQDERLPDYLGIRHLRRWLEFRVRYELRS